MKMIGVCAVCGTKAQLKGGKWVHQRPQPSGHPWDHTVKMGKGKR